MKINTSYPYPVLFMNNDDYLNSSFNSSIEVQESFGEVRIQVRFELDNDGINSLIEDKRATYLVHIECGQTSYRNAFSSFNKILDIAIPSELLRGKVEIHSFITANERIEDYTNDKLNEWYADSLITFEKGNILAIGEAIETTLYEDNTELLNLPSIVKVIKSHRNEFMEVEIQSDTITVALPTYEYNQYATNAKSRLKQTILSNVILPSLVYVFSKINDNRDDLAEYTWYQVLEKIFDENNLRIEDVGTDALSSLKAAQMVLRKPLKASFEEIEKL
ncbi:hypothetical protein [Ornithinibacillus halotolerans]|uniref:Uncharacterized protein n=1 Tax=Ornithinibacillus halotolerans TaxID=1274357 RepID=A0A916S415_9BACI|nr:hypothetical protein [Ornithinibacillus halotolerans]GGA80152.1 hypothetical protein GCM10008025_24440 [Ornithinibacillus halotolerans]